MTEDLTITTARQWCENWHRLNPHPKSPNALLLRHGVEYKTRKPSPFQGTAQACYANSQFLVKRRKGWRYVEGYAISAIPTEHAWCVDPEGNVIDPTWDDDHPVDYFGIAFDMKLVGQIRKLPGGRSFSVLWTWWKWQDIYPRLEAYLEARS